MGLENLDAWKLGALLLLGLLVFGDRLPKVIADGLRTLRQLRDMARAATTDLSRELGTDVQLADLHPDALIREHLLGEDDQAALSQPLRDLYHNIHADLHAAAAVTNPPVTTAPNPAACTVEGQRRGEVRHPVDPDAT